MARYPYYDWITMAVSIFFDDSFYLFGGWYGSLGYLSEISSFSPVANTWTQRGQLVTARANVGLVWTDNSFLIIGGFVNWFDNITSEKCNFNGDQLQCVNQQPTEPYCE